MKATLVYVSERGRHGIVSIRKQQKQIGCIVGSVEVASGWCEIEPGSEVGMTFEVPAETKISTVERGDFTWLELG